MFRMLGKIVQLIRYTVAYNEDKLEIVERCVSAEHKDEIEQMLTERSIDFATKAVDQTENEWLNGLTFSSRDEAAAALEAGEQAYLQQQAQQQLANNLRLRADIDYVAIMAGVEI